MGERNTILAVAVILVAIVATVFGILNFRYKMEAEALEKRIAVVKDAVQNEQTGIRVQLKTGVVPQIAAVEKAIEQVKKDVDNKDDGLLRKADDARKLIERHYQAAQEAGTAREAADKKRQEATKAAGNELGQAYGDLVKQMAALETEIEGEEKKLRDELDALLAEKAKEHGNVEQFLEKISKLNAEIAILEAKLNRMRERRARLEELREDGKVLSATVDGKVNMAVVNIGKRQGVRPGMVFDIFEVKRDGEKVRKGKLRLREVQSQQSFGTVLAARDIPKFCPKCGWSTTDITHTFCTYCLGGEDEKEREAMRLAEGSTKDRVTAPEFLNPVKEGDFISSPFYLGRLKQKAFTFAIIGQAADRSSQEIGMFLRENGCTLANSITLETDFAVVGLGPNVWQEVDRARKMGVSVIRESELFDFFGQTGTSPDAAPPEGLR
jgi:Zn finger protein HypA/HybF involved in hydrogenase expression